MKKLLFIIVALLCLTACNKNKEVDINYKANLKVYANEVMSDFQEFLTGDLEFEASDKLRISIFVYNENGEFIKTENRIVKNYDSPATFDIDLENGIYKIIASSDVLDEGKTPYFTFTPGSSIEYFKAENTSQYIGFTKETLGLVCSEVNINNKSIAKNIKIRPASFMMVTRMIGVHTFSDVYEYILCAEDNPEIVSYHNGTFVSSVAASGYTHYLSRVKPANFTAPNVYGLRGMLPAKNLKYYVNAYDNNGNVIATFGEGTKTFEVGKQYLAYISIADLTATIYDWEDLPKVVMDPNADKNFVEYLLENNFVESNIAE